MHIIQIFLFLIIRKANFNLLRDDDWIENFVLLQDRYVLIEYHQ